MKKSQDHPCFYCRNSSWIHEGQIGFEVIIFSHCLKTSCRFPRTADDPCDQEELVSETVQRLLSKDTIKVI